MGKKTTTSEPAKKRKLEPAKKPWMRQRANETTQEWVTRTNHTCYACGLESADLDKLAEHEAIHRSS